MLKPRYILLVLYIASIHTIFAQNIETGARSAALSNAFVSVSDTWSTFHNQATLATQQHSSAGIFYESKFMLDEFSVKAATIVIPVKSIVTGLSFYQFGQNDYKEYKIGFSVSKQLSEKLNAALQFDYFASRLPENEQTFRFVTFEAGASYQATQQICFGLHIFNPVKSGFDFPSGKQEFPITLKIGGHYQFEDYVMLCLETEKSTDEDFMIKSGIEFMPLTNLALRLGVSGEPIQLSGGLGYLYKNIRSDIAFCYHQYLGFTPSVSIQFVLK
jgi:hypothetical protein